MIQANPLRLSLITTLSWFSGDQKPQSLQNLTNSEISIESDQMLVCCSSRLAKSYLVIFCMCGNGGAVIQNGKYCFIN